MSSALPEGPPPPAAPSTPAVTEHDALRTSVVAVFLGIVLALVVSRLFTLVGWGGDLASQAAGAASGTGPLLIDGLRQRRDQRSRRTPTGAPGLRTASRFRVRPSAVLVAGLYGFALAIVDTALSVVLYRLTRLVIRRSAGDLDRLTPVFTVVIGIVSVPLVLLAAAALAARATHYLLPRPKRWIGVGLAVYAVLRAGLLLTVYTEDSPWSRGLLIAGALLLVPVLFAVALLGVWWARRTHVAFSATRFFRRLPPDDQEAALTLLEESVQPRPGPPGSAISSADPRLGEGGGR